MANKPTGRKTGRINVKKLKENPKELNATEQKKVKGGEGAVFTSVSNVLKTRHDTVKNSIGN